MKVYKDKAIPAKTESVLDHLSCDMCGSRINIGLSGFKVDEVEISHETGQSYPEGGMGDRVIVDLCGDCFDSRLIPWLKTQGVKPTKEELDY